VLYLTRDRRGPSLEEQQPELFANLLRHGRRCREKLREEMQIEFTIADGRLGAGCAEGAALQPGGGGGGGGIGRGRRSSPATRR
jgi:hypothetical protein